MKTRLFPMLAASAAALCFASPVAAKDTAQTPPAGESRMATCSHEAKGLKGEERQQFMSKCLKGNGGSTADKPADKDGKSSHLAGQQNRMKTCNAEAGKKDLRGEERKKFMSTCLKG